MTRKTIGPLDKVMLDLEKMPGTAGTACEPGTARLAFIWGIGVSGPTPFEHLLLGKAAGDVFSLRVTEGHGQQVFGHLQCTLLQQLPMMPPYELQVAVRSIEPAENREVVKAMAEMGGCGGGCDCGCDG